MRRCGLRRCAFEQVALHPHQVDPMDLGKALFNAQSQADRTRIDRVLSVWLARDRFDPLSQEGREARDQFIRNVSHNVDVITFAISRFPDPYRCKASSVSHRMFSETVQNLRDGCGLLAGVDALAFQMDRDEAIEWQANHPGMVKRFFQARNLLCSQTVATSLTGVAMATMLGLASGSRGGCNQSRARVYISR